MGLRLSAQARREVTQQIALRYQEASGSLKAALLDELVAITGYARRYAMRLLTHPPQGRRPPKRQRSRHYGPEVQHALFLAWHAANRICPKRLMPFLPTLIEALERDHQFPVSEACRSQLLAMSAATADRLLQAQRRRGLGGIFTTRAGTWLKQQIPLRTFAQWNETRPGFLEVDLVAHCGSEAQGRFLSTLTLTDIATGWTECLPLRSKHAEEVLSAFHTARTLFPFPILGLDCDNGREFINDTWLHACEEEKLTFTRGRPDCKNDQCFVEQKNGTVVRQVVGHARFEGEEVYAQLGEVYQALRLYVNCFQPSMKLQAKQSDGKTVRRIYDAAKTPLQRLLLSRVLSAAQEREVVRMAHMLSPLRLLEHVQDLQQALFAAAARASQETEEVVPMRLCSFCLPRCLVQSGPAPDVVVGHKGQQDADQTALPDLVKQTPEVKANVSSEALAHASPGLSFQQQREAPLWFPSPTPEKEAPGSPRAPRSGAAPCTTNPGHGQPQPSGRKTSRQRARSSASSMTIAHAILEYLASQHARHRRPKTLEWHQHALGSWQRYLLTEQHCMQLDQLTPAHVEHWLVFLRQQPRATGALRSASTVQSYARSVRAFCHWAVQQQKLLVTPFAHVPLPAVELQAYPLLEPDDWSRLLQACQPQQPNDERAEQAAARNRAILWVLFETGMQATEVCRLRLGDVDRAQRELVVRGKGAQGRRLTLGDEGWRHLLTYLDDHRLKASAGGELGGESLDHLFLSEAGQPLTKSGISLVFGRLRKRAGLTGKPITAALLRRGFAARYLQAGGDLGTLQELLGQQDCASFQPIVQNREELRSDQGIGKHQNVDGEAKTLTRQGGAEGEKGWGKQMADAAKVAREEFEIGFRGTS